MHNLKRCKGTPLSKNPLQPFSHIQKSSAKHDPASTLLCTPNYFYHTFGWDFGSLDFYVRAKICGLTPILFESEYDPWAGLL
jgi:hypothetical protein